jgi:hypothetical protein
VKPAHLFAMRTATRFATKMNKGSLGQSLFMGPNPPYGAIIGITCVRAFDGTDVKLGC